MSKAKVHVDGQPWKRIHVEGTPHDHGRIYKLIGAFHQHASQQESLERHQGQSKLQNQSSLLFVQALRLQALRCALQKCLWMRKILSRSQVVGLPD